MYRIRFHGRGGQGMKTASRILGTALFRSGLQVQDAPRYGAERRGAPMFAYVRAGSAPIHERGNITRPDLVLVADDSLVSIPAAGVCQGLDHAAVLLVVSRDSESTWAHRLNLAGPVLVLPPDGGEDETSPLIGAALAGAAARLLGVVQRDALVAAIDDELGSMPTPVRDANRGAALDAWDAVAAQAGIVTESAVAPVASAASPDWVGELFEAARISAPVIHDQLTSVEVRTGLWRMLRPVIDEDLCNRCWWVCSTFCPDSAIDVGDDGRPSIDYDHCKGCMICVAKCPPHAIKAIPETAARQAETPEATS
jgi:pyruvate ferredoxin oxidoreductase gamma subunit